MAATLAVLATLSSVTRSEAQFNVIELGSLFPNGGQAGTEVDVSVASGNRIEEIDRLHFSHPGITAELVTGQPLPFTTEPVPDYGKFRVKIAAETPPGRYEVRAQGRHGVSNPRFFLVNHLPVVETGKTGGVSDQSAQPMELPLNHVAHVVPPASQMNFFSLSLEAGQQVQVDLVAQRLDSWMIGSLSLADPSGITVAAARGGDGVDPKLNYRAAQAGTYRLVVHDFLYRGGADFVYQLAARTGDELGKSLMDGPHSLPHLAPSSATVSHSTVSLSQANTVEESELHSLTVPSALAGAFDGPRDEDVFEFSANANEKLVVEVISQRLGQPSDPRLEIFQVEPQASGDPRLKQVLSVDDSQNVGGPEMPLRSKDPVAIFNPPATATYRIAIRDLDTGEAFGKSQPYVLAVRKLQPRFDLIAYRSFAHKDANLSRYFGSKIFRGGGETIRVLAVRHDGWAGPIEISVEGLPAGIQCQPAVMGANQTQTQLTLVGTDDAAAGTGPIRVIGKATINGNVVQQPAQPAAFRSGRAHSREFVQSRLCHELMVSVSDQDVAPLSIRWDQSAAKEVKKNESLKLPIKLIRRDGGKAECVLRPRDLPPGVTAGEVKIAGDKSEAALELKVSSSAAAGTYSLSVQGETKMKLKPNPQALRRAQQYRSHLQKLHDDPAQAANLEAIQSAIRSADARVEVAKAQDKEQELTVFLPSPHVTIRVVDP
ncbi:MAG: PPC domain-containing protein [Pirellulales bacterium]|nr:PPC domain-containing protein [Pirellulales bacterium]